MSSKKILFILDHLKGGGAERIALEVAEEFYNNGYDISIALLDDKETRMLIPEHIKKINIDLDPIFYTGKFWRKRKEKFLSKDKQKIRELVDEINPNLTILSHSYAHLILPIFKKTENVWPWIHSEIMPPPKKETSSLFYWYKEKRRYYLEHGSFVSIFNKRNIITVNEDLKTSYQTHLPESNIVVIPNGVNSKRVLKDTSLNSDIQWNCIFVGRLSPEKQPEHAIKAFAKSGLEGKMAIVGDGIMESDMYKLCDELQISDRVDFLGWQKNPSEFIIKSQCLVLSSNIEGSPLIIAEALTLGVPVVSYQINSGIEQQLNHSQLKRGLVENQNIDSLSEKIYEIAKKPYTISQEDKNRVSLNFMMKSFENLL